MPVHFIKKGANQVRKNIAPVPPRSAELTPKAATIVDRIKNRTRIPKKFLIEEAIVNYLPKKYERR